MSFASKVAASAAPRAAAAASSRGVAAAPTARAAAVATATATAAAATAPSSFLTHLVVLDFEATCDDKRRVQPQEIIEFPAVLVDVATGTVVDEFQQYVKPDVHPRLTQFCTELTGIQQHQTDAGVSLPEAMASFNAWLASHGMFPGGDQVEHSYDHTPAVVATGRAGRGRGRGRAGRARGRGALPPRPSAGPQAQAQAQAPAQRAFCIVTCGDWDLGSCLRRQLTFLGLPTPTHMRSWINIKHAFQSVYGRKGGSMVAMLDRLKLPLKGRHHSGIDDSRNIARIAIAMLKAGWTPQPTGHR